MARPTTRPLKESEARIYRNAGDYADPDLVELAEIRIVEQPDQRAEDDVTVRKSRGEKWVTGQNRERELNFQMPNIVNANLTAIRTAYAAETPVEFFVMDYALEDTAAVGSRAFYQIMSCTLMTPDNKAQYWDVKCKPTWSAQPAEPVTGGTSWNSALGIS